MERIANYTLLQRIAVSETSEISLARGDSQNVAIKRILSPKHNASAHAAQSLSEDLQSDEFTFASAIRHENLVSTYEILQEGSSFVVVMEWVDGYDLRQIVQQANALGKSIPPLFAAYIVKQAAKGLHCAHRYTHARTEAPASLIHRDLNLSSVVVSKEGAVKVLNQFGLASKVAKATTNASTTLPFGHTHNHGVLKGRASSLSPEYLTWGVVDQRHDIFALGMILYELLTGHPPFGSDDEDAIQKRIMTEEPTPFSVWNPNLPTSLTSVVIHALAKDPNQRYASALDLAAELDRCIQLFPKANITETSIADFLGRLFPEALTEAASSLNESNDQRTHTQETSSSTSPSLTTISSIPPTGKPSQEIGKYALYEEVGGGGQASVYKAWHKELQSWVAIKLLKDDLVKREDTRERFKREARLQFRLQHPNLVRVIEILEESGRLGMVMDWIDGEDLEGYLSTKGKLSYEEIKQIFLPVLAGVGFAHRHNIVHRDLKPSNILLDRTQGSLVPKVTDFGIAKSFLQGDSQTKTGSVLGTPSYIAPEQAKSSKHVDHRADIYALGITLYQMLTGTPPFVGNDFLQVIVSHIHQAPPSFASLGLHHPAEIEAVVIKAIRKDPAERFKTCQEFAHALETALTPYLTPNTPKNDLHNPHSYSHPQAPKAHEASQTIMDIHDSPVMDIHDSPVMDIHDSPENETNVRLKDHDASQTIMDVHISFPTNLPPIKKTFHNQETLLFDEPSASPLSDRRLPALGIPTTAPQNADTHTRKQVRRWPLFGLVAAVLLSLSLLASLFFALTKPSSLPRPTTPASSAPPPQTSHDQLNLHLSTTPSGADIYVDAARIGPSPTVLVLKKRSNVYQLVIRHPGYQSYERVLRVRHGAQKFPLHIQLKPLAK